MTGEDGAVVSGADAARHEVGSRTQRHLALLLSMAIFVLVVDTSTMIVSITAVADDLDTSTTELEALLAEQPAEIVDINSDAGNLAVPAAMLIPVLACLVGFANSFRMMRLPDFAPSAAAEGVLGG